MTTMIHTAPWTHWRPRFHAAAALAIALLCLSGAGVAAGAERDTDFMMSGTGKLRAKGLGTLKIPVTVSLQMSGYLDSGTWSVYDGTEGFSGTYAGADTKGRRFVVYFDGRSLSRLGQELKAEVMSETRIEVQVISVTQRPAVFKVDKKGSKGSIKLVFDVTALVNGEIRIATYALPLKGMATSAQ